MKRVAVLLLCGMVLSACAGPKPRTGFPAEEVRTAAVWPIPLERIRRAVEAQCLEAGRESLEPCFFEVMERLGADPAAVRFSESLESAAYLRALHEAGPVDVGWVSYPFRANELYGCFLLNGAPARMDVDDPAFWPEALLKQHVRYRLLREGYPEVSVWPGLRGGPGHLAAEPLPDGGTRFLVGYELRDGCHACEIVGTVDFAFDFDGEGRFLGSRPAAFGSVLHGIAGRTLSLSVERGGCGRWQLVRFPPSGSLRLKSKVRGSTGPGGRKEAETWTFLALRPGRYLVDLRCVPTGRDTPFPTARRSFLVVVHEDESSWSSSLDEVFAPVVNERLREMGSPRAGRVDMRLKGVHGDLARVDIAPRNPASEAWALVYLKRRQGTWEVLGMGRHFSRSFYRTHGVPEELRGPVDPAPPVVPLSGSACGDLLVAVSEALGLEGRLENPVPFFEPSRRAFGEACRITLQGTGDRLPETREVAETVRSVVEDLGWREDAAYAADGPLGTAAGFRKGTGILLLRVIVEPSEEVGLLSNRPVSTELLLPEELQYTVVMEGAQQPTEQPVR